MHIKKGASLAGLKIEMRFALYTLEGIYAQYDKELVITSGTDGTHEAGSLHYYGYSIDCRTHYFTPEELEGVIEDIKT